MATQPALNDPKTTTGFVHSSVPALARYGVEVVAVSPGSVTLRMPIDQNSNHVGTMYAGALFAIAELPGGLLPWTVLSDEPIVPIAKHAEVSFRRPATGDVFVTATLDPPTIQNLAATALAEGKVDMVLRLSVVTGAGAEVMSATTVTQLRRLPSDAG